MFKQVRLVAMTWLHTESAFPGASAHAGAKQSWEGNVFRRCAAAQRGSQLISQRTRADIQGPQAVQAGATNCT